ncbi:hypothetical protein TRFO_24539 [Tritrichomonas foetus]|uniref:Uncharacterized protein n=1 Tax=Tritrichomonas foetus TaxID=1144522 RepID=A0A1J4K7J3_9EUKA|nr:hypothetical protein TRFO_24539 [Tritrichomonas foetus]|eukprot:OHT07351.1 hypothetical protein TRFO_24539 [Tritrichomonas foetus]
MKRKARHRNDLKPLLLFLQIYCVLYIPICLKKYPVYPTPPQYDIGNMTSIRKPGIYLAVITGIYNIGRVRHSLETWIPELRNASLYDIPYQVEIVFVSESEIENNLNIRTVISPEDRIKQDIQRINEFNGPKEKDVPKVLKTFYALHDFYYNTNCDWFKHQDDDTGIYVPNFRMMFDEYTSRFDPRSQIVAKGACTVDLKFAVNKGVEDLYSQGGTGLLLSRKAAKFFLDNFDDWYKNFSFYEDRYVWRMLEKMGVTGESVSSTYFIGSEIPLSAQKALQYFQYDRIEECPAEHPLTRCKPEFYQLNKIVSYHREPDFYWLPFLLKNHNIDDSIRFYDNRFKPKVCRMVPKKT